MQCSKKCTVVVVLFTCKDSDRVNGNMSDQIPFDT